MPKKATQERPDLDLADAQSGVGVKPSKMMSLGGLHNKQKRVIGGKYPAQRFSIGDILKYGGMKARVLQRDVEKQVIWVWLIEGCSTMDIKMNDGNTYEFLEECPPR